jgi:hypothetical protein
VATSFCISVTCRDDDSPEASRIKMIHATYLTEEQAKVIHNRVVEFTKEQVEAHRGKS